MHSEARHHLQRNAIAGASDAVLWFFGTSFLATGTILPVYFSHLSDSRFLLGLLLALIEAAWFLPQLLTAGLVERLPRKKPLVLILGLVERAPFLFLALGTLWFVRLPPSTAVALFFTLVLIRSLAGGVAATPWQELIAKIIPLEWRGQFLSISHGLGGVLGLAGSAAAALLLARFSYPQNFFLVFLAGFSSIMLSWVGFAFTIEPDAEPAAAQPTPVRRRLASIVRDDHNFRTYLFARGLGHLGAMAFGFLAVSSIQRFGLGDWQAAIYTAVLSAAGMLASRVWAMLGDQFGHKPVVELATLAWAGALALALAAPDSNLFYGVFVFVGAANAGLVLADLAIVMEFGPEAERPTYIGLARTLSAPFVFAAPLLGGAVAQLVGDAYLFWLALAFTLSSWILLRWRVVDPRAAAFEQD